MNTRPNNSHQLPSTDRRSTPVVTTGEMLREARQRLQPSSPSPALDASVLLCHVLDCAPSHLIARPDRPLSPEQQSRFDQALQQRLHGRPVAYITGEKEFWSLSLSVTPDVLIPRPETETLVEFALAHFADTEPLEIADIGTGSGAIACALAIERPRWIITATDASAAALQVAHSNVSAFGLENVRLRHGCWYEPLAGLEFDLIVSNPPYVAAGDPHLSQGDVRFEPVAALASGEHGMDAITHLVQEARNHLKAGGWLAVEHGYDQQQQVYDRFADNGFANIIQLADLAGQPRVTAGRYARR